MLEIVALLRAPALAGRSLAPGRLRPLCLPAAVLLLGAAPPGKGGGDLDRPSRPAPSAGAELHDAPVARTQNAPPEAQLSPPPEAERAQPSGYIVVTNPAFPSAPPPSPVEPQGRRYEASDLAPYFGEGLLAQARAAYDAGRHAEARALLEPLEDASPPVRYLRALAALHAGDAARAADELAPLASDYPALADRCLAHGGIAREELGQWEEAAALFERVPPGSRLYADARLGLSRARRRLGDLPGAIEALSPLAALPAPSWGRDIAAEAMLAIADLARAARDARREEEALVELWSRHPLSPLAAQAERRLKGRKVPREAVVARGERLVDAHRNALGRGVLEPLLPKLKPPDPLACRAHFSFGKALRKERSHSRAIEVLAPVVERCADPDLRVRALYVLASSRSIVGAPDGAATYERIVHDYPAHSFADDALFYAADLYLRQGDPRAAMERLEELARAYPDGDFASEALFKMFWILRAQQQLPEALAALARLEAQFARAEESYDVERAQYWRARVLEDSGARAQAAELLEALATAHPVTYYGLLARRRLEELDRARHERVQAALASPPAARSPWPLFAGPMGDDPHFRAGVELLRLGFPEAAAAELLAVNRAGRPAEAVRLLVMALSLAGDTRSAHAVTRIELRRDLSGPITARTRPFWEIAYPNAFRDLIEKHCTAADLDPDLLQALMREESALDPKALSWAGALGLTQLMPSTARAVARAHKLPRPTQAMLLDPDWNIRLGALELGSLVRRFDGVKSYALAGYNAGGGAVRRWQAARPESRLDEWVEEIPISETRGYVKRVLRSYATYQALYARPLAVQAPGAAR